MTANDINKDDNKKNSKSTAKSKHESNKVGLALMFAMIGAIIICIVFRIENLTTVFIICLALAGIGYFGIASWVFKKSDKQK